MFRKLMTLAVAAVLTLAGIVAFDGPANAQGGNVIVISGDITQNLVLKRKKTYLLQGGVFVREGAKLTIKAGTTINCDTGSFLVIDKGAKIIAKGTAAKPIVFTSAQPAMEYSSSFGYPNDRGLKPTSSSVTSSATMTEPESRAAVASVKPAPIAKALATTSSSTHSSRPNSARAAAETVYISGQPGSTKSRTGHSPSTICCAPAR